MANPPFNLKGWYDSNLKNDSRWTDYSTPPESNANYAWILHILSHLKSLDGVAGFLLANGALGDSDTVEIRKKLIQHDKVEAIIILPRELFITTDISVTLWILNQNKKGGKYHGRTLRNRQGLSLIHISFPSALPLFQQLDDRIADLLVRVALREIFANVLPLEFILLLLVGLLFGEDVVDCPVLQHSLLRKLL